MTPAERDDVRGMARAHMASPTNRDCSCPACRIVEAADRYTPTGDATSNGVEFVSVSTAKHATNPVVLTVSKTVGRGRIWAAQRWLTVSEARIIGLALLAAADAAEED